MKPIPYSHERPAYPRPASEFTKNGTLADGNDAVEQQDGMTIRQVFILAAMQGLAAAHTKEYEALDEVGRMAVALADYTLEAMDKRWDRR